MLDAPEFSRRFDARQAEGRSVTLSADASERAALARRFGIVRIDRLAAQANLARHGSVVDVKGSLEADIVQSCAISAEDLPVAVRETLDFRFVPAGTDARADEEIELDADDCDEIEFSGAEFDLGEAVAQTLALAIDPFATGPEAEAVRKAGLLSDPAPNPFAVLKDLKKSQ